MHLLLIEDNPGYSEVLGSILLQKLPGMATLRTASSVDEGIAAIDTDHPLDIVVTDTQLRRGSCIDILCAVKRWNYDLIFMSNMDGRDFRVRSMLDAGFAFYSKHEDVQKLMELIQVGQLGAARFQTEEKIRRLRPAQGQ